ncbi:MAG TPA: asparagine synthase (glutamine-hydrolyzing) [Myxococcales bacterium]
MCGISGFVNRDKERPADQALLRRMTDVIAHRGPDGDGHFVAGPVALGHRRLSIIDLSANGAQPMHGCDDAKVTITFNGEIYNYLELREELLAKGHRFHSRCDTEVIVHGYEEWGDELPKKLAGMFAFAIWDARKETLFLARDRLGKKPVYYYLGDERFIFGSEIKSLLCDESVPRNLDNDALDLYLSTRYVPAPLTMFAGIQKLPPGSCATYKDGELDIKRFWRVEFPAHPDTRSDDVLAKELWARSKEATKARLMADVPVGVFLSGGLDSSCIAAQMIDLRKEAGEGGVKSFSVGYKADDGSSELDQARRVAAALGTEHREVLVTAEDFHAFLPQLVWHLDEPVADAACVPLYYLSKRAREEVVVVLSGEGADEVFAGYPVYRTMLLMEQLRLAAPFAGTAARFVKDPKVRKYLRWMSLPLEQRYRGISVAFADDEKAKLTGLPASRASERVVQHIAGIWRETKGLPPLERMLELDRRVWLPDDLLVKADKITMATSVELRVPFLDHRLIEWSAGLPASVKLRNGSGKWILREAARHRLPAECVAPGKRGFTVPVANWMRKQLYEPLRDELLASDSLPRTRFGEKAVRELIEEHKSGKADRKEELYALWVLEKWRKRFQVGPAVAKTQVPNIQTQLKRKAGPEMGALKGRDIVCFSNDWDGDPLSKMHAMKILARDNRVLWVNSIGNRRPTASARDARRIFKKISGAVEGLKERHPNIWVLTPLALPFYGSEWVRAANGALLKAQVQRAMQQLDFKDVISWSFLPSSAPVSGTLGESLVVYHCVDEFSAFSDAPAQEIRELERRLMLKADVVICSSEKLREDKARVNPNSHLVQHGVDLEHFAKAFAPTTTIPDELKGAPGPIIGFWGLIADWVDLQLIRHVADAFSGGTVVLVGNSTTDMSPLEGAKNIRVVGRKPYSDLPRYAKAFDVSLMPFRVNELTLAANPLKVREYLAAGLPCVSTAIPEVERLGVCRIGKDPDDVVREIAAAISAGAGPSEVRAAQMRSEGWEARVAEMQEIVAAALLERKKQAA